MNPTITADFRDYIPDDPKDATFSLNTATADEAVLTFQLGDQTVVATYGHDAARNIGTDLMQWIGSPLCSAYDDYRTALNGAGFEIDVVDGIAQFTAANEGVLLAFSPNFDQAIDIAQRLIVWAGVKVAADA